MLDYKKLLDPITIVCVSIILMSIGAYIGFTQFEFSGSTITFVFIGSAISGLYVRLLVFYEKRSRR